LRAAGQGRILYILRHIPMEAAVNKHDPAPKRREAALFKSNRSQAVRIPKELAFPDGVKKVEITPTEDGGLLIKPVKRVKDWAAYFRTGPFLTDDFPDRIDDPVASDDVSFDD
jgi:antitoxin VapB